MADLMLGRVSGSKGDYEKEREEEKEKQDEKIRNFDKVGKEVIVNIMADIVDYHSDKLAEFELQNK